MVALSGGVQADAEPRRHRFPFSVGDVAILADVEVGVQFAVDGGEGEATEIM